MGPVERMSWRGTGGKERRRLRNFILKEKKRKKKNPAAAELRHLLTSAGTKPDPREDPQSLQLTWNLGEI